MESNKWSKKDLGNWDSSECLSSVGELTTYIRLSRRGEIVTLKVTQINPVAESSSNNFNNSSSTVEGVMKGNERMKKGISQMLGIEYKAPSIRMEMMPVKMVQALCGK